jgi:hypothetical protein
MDNDSRSQVVALIARGALPSDPKITTVGSTSEGQEICCICEQLVASGTAQIELAPNPPAAYASGYLVMHPLCHQAWLEVVSVESVSAASA